MRTEEAVVGDDVEIEAIAMADLGEVPDETARRVPLLHRRKKNQPQI